MLPRPIRAAAHSVVEVVVGYNELHVWNAWAAANRPRTVLVVGANDGSDCRRFIRLGACEVVGLDPMADVGHAFRDARAHYVCSSIESCALPSDYFDLVFATATLEHVRELRSCIHEMFRVVKPGGCIWSFAAPLWNSPYGHHMPDCFRGHPWVHLLFDKAGIIAYGRQHSLTGERGQSLEQVVEYMVDERFFNRAPAREYLAAVASVGRAEILTNEVTRLDESALDCDLGRRALAAGFEAKELLSAAHILRAKKR